MLDSLYQDLRYGWRMLLKSKGLTLAAVLSLAIGIGTNTVAFSVADEMLFKELPVQDPEELVLFRWTLQGPALATDMRGTTFEDGGARHGAVFSYPDYREFVRENRTLSNIFAFAPIPGQLNTVVEGRAEVAEGEFVSGGYYSGLGISAFRGRTITSDDDQPGADPVAMISYTYWRNRFGLDPGVIGKSVRVNGLPFTIVGVTGPEFFGALKNGREISIPLALEPRMTLDASSFDMTSRWWLHVMGRMKSPVNIPQVTANFEASFARAAAPATPHLDLVNSATGVEFAQQAIPPAVILHAIGGLVLLLICTNMANLMLARSSMRLQEATVRTALGAKRLRIVRQFLTETALLGLIGGTLGLAAAHWGLRLLVNGVLERDVAMGWHTLVFTAMLSILTGVLFGLAPALQTTRASLMGTLKDTARNVSGPRSRTGKILLITQMALSLILLSGAGLLARTLRDIQAVDVGFNMNNLISFVVNPQLNRYDGAQIAALYERMVEGIEAIPGVQSVTMSNLPLLGGGGDPTSIFIEENRTRAQAFTLRVRSNFFQTMEIPLVLGRQFDARDDRSGPPVAIISETVARQNFGNANPLGKRFGFAAEQDGEFEVVGVARDAKYFRLSDPNPAIVYMPASQGAAGAMFFGIRAAGNPQATVTAIRQAVQQVDSDVSLFAVTTNTEQRSELLMLSRALAAIGSGLGVIVLLLACIGLYGIMSYNVTSRTNEIGVRMALGARRFQVVRLVMKQTGRLVLIGLVIGLPACFAVTQVIASLFYGIAPTDPFTIALAMLIMVGVTALAGYLPACRAARVNPIVALRHE